MDILKKSLENVKTYVGHEGYNLTLKPFVLNLILIFNDYLMFILTNKWKSLTLEIENFVEKFFNDNEEKLMKKQNFSKQRQKCGHEVFFIGYE